MMSVEPFKVMVMGDLAPARDAAIAILHSSATGNRIKRAQRFACFRLRCQTVSVAAYICKLLTYQPCYDSQAAPIGPSPVNRWEGRPAGAPRVSALELWRTAQS